MNRTTAGTQARGNALILALIAMMLGVAVMLWVTQLSADNFRRTDRHLFKEDSFYAAQGAADAIVADIKEEFAKKLAADETADFMAWLPTYIPALGAKDTTATFDGTWAGKKFNAATVNKTRITRRDIGTDSSGHSIALYIEVEASPTNSDDPADAITVTKLLNATNRQNPDLEYAILTQNISCTVCHLRVSTLEFAKNVEGEAAGNTFKRALLATTKSMNIRFTSADSEIHGSFYISAGARLENSGAVADMDGLLGNSNFRMAALTDGGKDANGNTIANFTGLTDGDGVPTREVALDTHLSDSSGNTTTALQPGKPLYLKYPGSGDYALDDKFPSPFPDVGDSTGIGAKNRQIDPVELQAREDVSKGTITASNVTKVPLNTNENYHSGVYKYSDNKMPNTAALNETTIQTGEQSNVILIGTKDHPIQINGNVVIEGDVMIKGYVQGTGLIMATGNIYIPTDVKYLNKNNPAGKEVFETANRIGYAAGGNIVVGDYISKVNGSHSATDYQVGQVDTGSSSNGSYANYISEQLALANRDELAKALKQVPTGGGDLANAGTYGATNTSYDATYTPRYYTMYPDTPPMAFIRNGGGAAKYDLDSKAWITGEAPTNYDWDQFAIPRIPTTVVNDTKTPRLVSVHPNWISPENMHSLIANEESIRYTDSDRNSKPFRIDGLLYTSNAIFSMQRNYSSVQDSGGNWVQPKPASHGGRMEINGSIIAPDLGILVAGGTKNAFKVNYDSRLKSLINGFEPGKWKTTDDGFARFSGPLPATLPEQVIP